LYSHPESRTLERKKLEMKIQYLFPLLILLSACAEPTTVVLSDADVSTDSGSADAGAPVLVDAGVDAEDSTVPLPSDAGDVVIDAGEMVDASLSDAATESDAGELMVDASLSDAGGIPDAGEVVSDGGSVSNSGVITRDSLFAQCEEWLLRRCAALPPNCSNAANWIVLQGESCMVLYHNYWNCYLTAYDAPPRDCERHSYAESVCGPLPSGC